MTLQLVRPIQTAIEANSLEAFRIEAANLEANSIETNSIEAVINSQSKQGEDALFLVTFSFNFTKLLRLSRGTRFLVNLNNLRLLGDFFVAPLLGGFSAISSRRSLLGDRSWRSFSASSSMPGEETLLERSKRPKSFLVSTHS